MRDAKVVKIEDLNFGEIKKAFEEMKAASDRISEIIRNCTGINDWKKFSLNRKYESAGFYLYEETACVCGKVHEENDPPQTLCMFNAISQMQPTAVFNLDQIAPEEQNDATNVSVDPTKKH